MQSKIYTYAMRYGIYIGLLIALNTILSSTNNAVLSMLSWAVWGVMIYLMYFFTQRFINNETEDHLLSFGQTFRFNMLMYFFGAMVATALRIVYFKWLNPEVLEEVFSQSMQILDKSLTGNDRATVRETLNQLLKPVSYSFLCLFGDFISGLFYAIIIAAVSKQRNNRNINTEDNNDPTE